MKSFEEMSENVLKRVEEYEQKKAERKKTMVNVAASAAVLCCTVSAIVLWKNGVFDKNRNKLTYNSAESVLTDSAIDEKADMICQSSYDEKEIIENNNISVSENNTSEVVTGNTNEIMQSIPDIDDCLGYLEKDGKIYLQTGCDDIENIQFPRGEFICRLSECEGAYKDDGGSLYKCISDENILLAYLENGGIIVLEEDSNNLNSDLMYKEMISSYPLSYDASYCLPYKGGVGISMPLQSAMEEYGDSVIYRIAVDIFDDNNSQFTDKSMLSEEAERLSELGYISVIDTYTCLNENSENTEYNKLELHSTLEQVQNFPANPDYKYFLFLSEERE